MQLLHDLGIEPGRLLINIIGFVLLLWFFVRYLWGPIARFMADRAREIETQITETKRLNEEARVRHETLQGQLQQEREQVRADIAQLTQEAKAAVAEMHTEGRRERQELIDQGRREIERSKDIALAELKKTVSELAVEISSKVIREALDEQRQEALIDGFLRDVEAAAGRERTA